MTEIRCVKCKRLLMKTDMVEGTISVKCGKCGYVNTVIYKTSAVGMTLPNMLIQSR